MCAGKAGLPARGKYLYYAKARREMQGVSMGRQREAFFPSEHFSGEACHKNIGSAATLRAVEKHKQSAVANLARRGKTQAQPQKQGCSCMTAKKQRRHSKQVEEAHCLARSETAQTQKNCQTTLRMLQ